MTIASRRFVVIGQRALASADFSLADLPSTSGRLDVLLRCLRAALMVSHGLRRDVTVYLVLLGGPRAPRTLRFESASIRFVRPDERSLAVMVQKALAAPALAPGGGSGDGSSGSSGSGGGSGFVSVRAGLAIADGGLDAVLDDLGPATPYVLEERAPDVRSASLDAAHPVFLIGDHLGFDDATRARIAAIKATPISVGPTSIHADDVIAVLSNELDRRGAECDKHG